MRVWKDDLDGPLQGNNCRWGWAARRSCFPIGTSPPPPLPLVYPRSSSTFGYSSLDWGLDTLTRTSTTTIPYKISCLTIFHQRNRHKINDCLLRASQHWYEQSLEILVDQCDLSIVSPAYVPPPWSSPMWISDILLHSLSRIINSHLWRDRHMGSWRTWPGSDPQNLDSTTVIRVVQSLFELQNRCTSCTTAIQIAQSPFVMHYHQLSTYYCHSCIAQR